MKEGKNGFIKVMSSCLIVVALCAQLPLAARADDGLKAETPSKDSAQSRPVTPTSPAPESSDSAASTAATARGASTSSEHTKLYGSARKHDNLPDATGAASASQGTPLDGNVVDNAAENAAKLQAEKAAADAYALAVQKLSQRQKLTAEDFRSLDIGILGYDSDQTFFQSIGKITRVYADFPAEQAGIRAGDKEICTEADPDLAAEQANPQQARWQVHFHKVGVPIEVTILRNKQPLKLTLITKNIEDIKEPKIRRMYEQMVLDLGYPKEGTFTGASMHDLARVK